MGIKFRKSLKAGPIRVNISKSGVGASVGVKGARVGIDAKGNSYAAGGKGGVYFRENLGSKGGENTQANTKGGGGEAPVKEALIPRKIKRPMRRGKKKRGPPPIK
jgi:hypothetical protein